MKKDNPNEIFPLVDPDGTVIGKATRGRCHDGSKLLHPVVHLHVISNDGAVYLQQRPVWKDIQPGRWDTAVGGHIDYGEEVQQALLREAREELGLILSDALYIGSYVFESDCEKELVNVFATLGFEGTLTPSDEVADGRFWLLAEINAAIGKGILTPNFEHEYTTVILPFINDRIDQKSST